MIVKSVRPFFLAVLCSLLVSCADGDDRRKEEADTSVRVVTDTDTAPDSETGLIVGFSQIGAESAWRVRNSSSMQEAAAKMGVQLLYANAEQKQENQIKAIRSFIVYQVDVIIFVPIVQYGWENVLNEAVAAGIPVIVADRKLKLSDPSLVAGFVGPDHLVEGENAARFLLRKYDGVPGPLLIFEIRGTDSSSASEDRAIGFRKIINADRRFKFVYSESGDFLRSKGKELVENFIREKGGFVFDDRPIDIIFSHNDGMTLGALEVLEEYGVNAGTDVTIVTFDAEQAAVDALKDGKVNCVVECNPDLGETVLTVAQKLSRGERIEYYTTVEERVFTEFENYDSLAPRGY